MKVFISQPMRGKTEEEILQERENAIYNIREKLGDENLEIEILESYFPDFKKNPKPLHFIAKSIEVLADADIVYFCNDWQLYRGCKIEHICAAEYGIKCIYH